MIKILNPQLKHRVKKGWVNAGVAFLLLSAVACGGSSGDPSDDDPGGGIIGTGIQIDGTVSTQYALASDVVEYKRQSGEKGSETVRSNGTFKASEVQGTGAVLLRTTTDNGDNLYALALPEDATDINQNVHSYSDLVARNWFATNGLDIDAFFASSDELTSVPTPATLRSLEESVSQISSGVQADYDLAGANIFTDPYLANGSGIDGFLVNNPVLINNGVINIFFVDPATNTQSQATSNLNVDSDLLGADTQAPTAPGSVRALPAASNEILVLWEPAIDNVAIARYDIFRNGELAGTTPYPVFSDMPVTPATLYTYTIVAVDSSGNESAASDSATTETLDMPDTVAPRVPTSLELVPAIGSIALSWNHGNNDDVASFVVSRSEGADTISEYLSVTSLAMTDLNVVDGEQYCYQVAAVDAAGNESAGSDVSCAIAGGGLVDVDQPGSGADPGADAGPETSDPDVTPLQPTPVENNVAVAVGSDGLYTLGTCGAEISTQQSSNDVDAPTLLSQGEVAAGTVVLDTLQAEQYWSFNVQPGNYALVVEATPGVIHTNDNIIINIIAVDNRGIEIEQVLRLNEVDTRVREIVPIIVGDDGLNLKMEASVIDNIDYNVVLYSLDDVIPSPFLADCPEIMTTSVGTTEALSLDVDDSKYYLMELEAGEYDLFIESAVRNGDSTNIIYEVTSYALTHNASSEKQLDRINDIASTLRSAVTITVEDDGFFYLRWHGAYFDYDIQFTITRL